MDQINDITHRRDLDALLERMKNDDNAAQIMTQRLIERFREMGLSIPGQD